MEFLGIVWYKKMADYGTNLVKNLAPAKFSWHQHGDQIAQCALVKRARLSP
jgi:hypothetical protein